MATTTASSGAYSTSKLQRVYWGPDCVSTALPDSLKLLSETNQVRGEVRALVMTGNSLATKTDIVKKVEAALGSAHAATYAKIGQHSPLEGIQEAQALFNEKKANVLIALGGGSAIDAAKTVALRVHDEDASTSSSDDERAFAPLIAIPTTLSAAECTQNAGRSEANKKVGSSHPALSPRVIICDASLTVATPERLWLSTGMRAVDHAVEFLYRSDPSPLLRMGVLGSLRELFYLLPATKRNPSDINIRQRLQLTAIASLFPESRKGALGLSHGLGHALGATYGIPHGITSCITLASAIETTAQLPSTSAEHLLALSEALDFIPAPYNPSPQPLPEPTSIKASLSGSALEQELVKARQRGVLVGKAVQRLVDDLGLRTTLKSANVPRSDIDGIASHVTGGQAAGGDRHDAVVKLLEAIYDDVKL